MTDSSPIRWQIYTGANPTVERIIPELAVEIGLNESIVLMQISHWISISKNLHNGVYWTYNTIRAMHKDYFPYWSVATIWRTITNLKEAGYIIVTNEFNKRKGDKTQWFALEPDKLSTLKSVLIAPALEHSTGKLFQNETTLFQNETTLPNTSSNIKKTIAPDGAGEPEKPKEKKAREPNPMYDAIKDIWGYTAIMNGAMEKMLKGTATKPGWKEYNLETPIEAVDLRRWAKWYRQTALKGDENLNMLEERIKINSSITQWQERNRPAETSSLTDDDESVGTSYTIGGEDDPFKDEIFD